MTHLYSIYHQSVSITELAYKLNYGHYYSIGFGPYSCSSSAVNSLFSCSSQSSSYKYDCNPTKDTIGLNCVVQKGQFIVAILYTFLAISIYIYLFI